MPNYLPLSMQVISAFVLLLTSLAAEATNYEVPRNVHGDPDLQGIWTSATITRLNRPVQFYDLILTPEQAAASEQAMGEQMEAIDNPSDPSEGGGVGGYNSFWMDPGTRVLRVRDEIRSSILVYPKDGQLPMRLGARAKLGQFFLRVQGAFDGPEQRPLGERCIVGFGSTGGPPMLPVLYNNNYQFVQSKDSVMILVEMNHDARIVRMNAEHLPDNVRPWMGDSIGRWEGDTLFVETTNFHPGQSFRVALKHQFYVTKDAIVKEWFTRVAEQEILYRFEVNDPGAYSDKWIGELTLHATEGPIYEYACHEANYAMRGILRGARLAETSPGED